mmetsp:Transcript_22884/g.45902  ORF Transcript_22884/g.45902 Transcript_22884/m.45902 type:complete len:574 (-) Transcript_22884:144-1865(-)
MTTPSLSPPPTHRAITLPLLRKRSEHNDNLVSTLEELALHQEELQAIGPLLGRTCGKTLKILLLPNNVIDRMDPRDLKFLKRLEYLNLALNNVRKIEGVEGMEWLRKLDLTLNFVGVEDLEESVDNLRECGSLEELFLVGNPCMMVEEEECKDMREGGEKEAKEGHKNCKRPMGWVGCRAYIIAKLPNLKVLDGKEIKRSERIAAMQTLPQLSSELKTLAETRRKERLAKQQQQQKENDHTNTSQQDDFLPDDEPTYHDPETRLKLSNELYHQKQAKEKQESAHLAPPPKGEKEWEEEHLDTVKHVREREQSAETSTSGNEGRVKDGAEEKITQCNQGKYQFWFEESSSTSRSDSNSSHSYNTKRKDTLVMRIAIPKYLSTSLIDVDIHPTYVSIVIKSKILRVVLPVEVVSDRSSAKRSTSTGYLVLIMPKVNEREVMVGLGHVRDFGGGQNAKEASSLGVVKEKKRGERLGASILKEVGIVGPEEDCVDQSRHSNRNKERYTSQELLLDETSPSQKENDFVGSLKIVNNNNDKNSKHSFSSSRDKLDAGHCTADDGAYDDNDDDDEPPPLC